MPTEPRETTHEVTQAHSQVPDGRSAAGTDLVHVPAGTNAAPGRRRRWGWLAALLALVAVAGVGFVVGTRVQSSDQAASLAAPPEPSWITVAVERRVLAQTVITRGDVRPEVTVTIEPPSSVEGSPVVTALGPAAGEPVPEGTRVIEVSGRPVFVLEGTVPVYRSLRPGMTGGDVTQLQTALSRLGCDTSTDGDGYGSATKACVGSLYSDAGYEPVPTSPTDAADLTAAEQAVTDADAAVVAAQLGVEQAARGPSEQDLLAATVSLEAAERSYSDTVASSDSAVALADADLTRALAERARVAADPAALPADRDTAQAAVEQADAAATQARRDRDSNVAAANDAVVLAQSALDALNAPADVTAEQSVLDQAVAARDRAQASLDALRAAIGPTVAQGEVVFAPQLPARVQTAATTLGPVANAGGDPATADTAASGGLMTLAAGDPVVLSTARPGERELVRVGMGVELLDEQTNTTYPARIAAVADTASVGSDGQSGYAMTIRSTEPMPDEIAGSNLRVTITAASTDTAALVVPAAAVSSAADGSTNVSVLGADGQPVAVPVVAGISADGFVAIEPTADDALRDGDQVVVGR